ncbi:LysR family transcriptional regulator [Paenirhodobacter sp.]|uniref:LysR family transcriptional regulator n=1 Tax=Paenirhodobacter sp. TaxID=1965326 RepID=UPI003B421759
MDRLTEMEAFIAVVDQGGFTDAARKLGLSKSAVSKYVSALETRLGARLLDRTTRRVAPTEVGLAYYDRAHRVVTDASDADSLVSALHAPPAGRLRISAPGDFGVAGLAPALNRFLAAYPEVTANVSLETQAPTEGMDVEIRVGGVDPAPNVHRLAQATRRLVASPAYLEKFGRPARIDDLNSHKLLHFSSQSDGNVWQIVAPSGERRLVRAGGWLTVGDGRALVEACVAGLGIAWLPGYLTAADLAAGRIEEVIPGLPPEVETISAVVPSVRYTPPKARALIDFLIRDFASAGPGAW